MSIAGDIGGRRGRFGCAFAGRVSHRGLGGCWRARLPGGVAEAGTTGKLLIDISTTEAEATKDMAARLGAAANKE